MKTYYVAGIPYSDELYHFGIKGQKWGIRRYQNEDGTLTAEGKARYGSDVERMAAKDAQRQSDANAAYGEGAGVRRKLLSKELDEKMKNKEYAKAFNEASKHVNVAKSLKRAESLNRHSGSFVRGRDLVDSGKTTAGLILNGTVGAISTGLLTVGVNRLFLDYGTKFGASVGLALAGVSMASVLGKTAKDVYSKSYYERNKKF